MRLLIVASLLLSISHGMLVVDEDKVDNLSADDIKRMATLHSKNERPTDCEAVKVMKFKTTFL